MKFIKKRNNTQYGSMFVPKSVKKTKDFGAFSASDDNGDALKRLTEDVARMRDEAIKQNRDNMDALYNIDMDNVSPSLRDLFKSWTNGISSADARITAIADSQGAVIEFVTQFRNSVSESVAQIQQKADKNEASISSIATWQGETTNAIASIHQIASANGSSIQAITKWQSGIDESISKQTEAIASIQQKSNENGASINLLTTWQSSVNNNISLLNSNVGEQKTAIAEIRQLADANGASIASITEWQSTTQGTLNDISSSVQTNTKSIASIQQQATEDGARIDLVVERKNGQNVINSAAISAAISEEESLLQLIANKVVISGTTEFVKREDLGDSGSTEVSGNRIALVMDGSYDDGQSSFDGNSSLRFDYKDENGNPHLFGWLYMQAEGVETDDTSRYALQIRTTSFRRSYDMRRVDPSIKLISAGRMSMEAQGQIYMHSDAWYILLESRTCLRVRANLPYADAVSEDAAAWNDYVFATDGIYYNGTKIVST